MLFSKLEAQGTIPLVYKRLFGFNRLSEALLSESAPDSHRLTVVPLTSLSSSAILQRGELSYPRSTTVRRTVLTSLDYSAANPRSTTVRRAVLASVDYSATNRPPLARLQRGERQTDPHGRLSSACGQSL